LFYISTILDVYNATIKTAFTYVIASCERCAARVDRILFQFGGKFTTLIECVQNEARDSHD